MSLRRSLETNSSLRSKGSTKSNKSRKSQSSELSEEAFLRYEFISAHLRQHFKRDLDEDWELERKQEAIKRFRQYRSANLITQIQFQKKANLYSHAIESELSKSIIQARTLGQLKIAFDQVRSGKLQHRTILQVQRQVIMVVQSCLSDCDIYLGMVLPKLKGIRYVASSSNSNMDNVQVASSEGASFTCIKSGESVVIDEILHNEDVKYFGKPSTRTGPFAAFPLRVGQSTHSIGVLSVDTCRKAARLLPERMSFGQVANLLMKCNLGQYAKSFRERKVNGRVLMRFQESDLQHKLGIHLSTDREKILLIIAALSEGSKLHLTTEPEWFVHDPSTIEMLEEISQATGEILHHHKQIYWLRTIEAATKDNTISVHAIYDIALQAILDCFLLIESCIIWRAEGLKSLYQLNACEIPEDQFAPFLLWNERQIKRLVILKEDPDSNGAVLKGKFQRIMTDDPDAAVDPDHLSNNADDEKDHEHIHLHATYHILWSNNSHQIMTWDQLKVHLGMHSLNPSNYKLKPLLQRLAKEENEFEIRMQEEGPIKGYLTTFQDESRPLRYKYCIKTDFMDGVDVQEAIPLIEKIQARLTPAIACIRGRERRDLLRRQSIGIVTSACKYLSMSPSDTALHALGDLITKIFTEINKCLPGVRIQLHEMLPKGDSMLNSFTWHHNEMTARRNPFDFIDHINSEAYVPRSNGTVLFESFEAASSVVISPFTEWKKMQLSICQFHKQEDMTWPYLVIPVSSQDAKVGVLSIDQFDDVEKGRADEHHPEHGVLTFAQTMARAMGNVLRMKRRSYALSCLSNLTQDPLVGPHHIFYHCLQTLALSLTCCKKAFLIECNQQVPALSKILYQYFDHQTTTKQVYLDSKEYTILEKIKYRLQELQLFTLMDYYHVSYDQALRMRTEANSLRPFEPLQNLYGKNFQFPATQQSIKYDSMDKEKHHLQIRGMLKSMLNKVDMMFSVVPFLTTRIATVVLVVQIQSEELVYQSDQQYVNNIAASMSTLCECMSYRLNRVQQRMKKVDQFRIACDAMLQKTEEHIRSVATCQIEQQIEKGMELQYQAISKIQDCIKRPNIYIGLHEPGFRLIRFTSASAGSCMLNRRLHRDKGVSFHALDQQKCIVFRHKQDKSELQEQLRHYTDPGDLKYPVIIVPCETAGVLLLNDFRQQVKGRNDEVHPEMGIVDFLSQIGQLFGQTMQQLRRQTNLHRRHLRDQMMQQIGTLCDLETFYSLQEYMEEKALLVPVLTRIREAITQVDVSVALAEPMTSTLRYAVAGSESIVPADYHVKGNLTTARKCFYTQSSVVVQFPYDELHDQDLYPYNFDEIRLPALDSKARKEQELNRQHQLFLCVPIPRIGILHFFGLHGGISGCYTEEVPEHGMMESLEKIGEQLSEALSYQRQQQAIEAIQRIVKDNSITFDFFMQKLCYYLTSIVLSCVDIQFVKIDMNAPAPDGAQVQPKSLQQNLSIMKASAEDVSAEQSEMKQQEVIPTEDPDEKKSHQAISSSYHWHQDMLFQREDDRPFVSDNPSFDEKHFIEEFFSQKELKEEETCFSYSVIPEWLVMPLDDPVLACPKSSHLLLLQRYSTVTWDAELEFLQQAQKHVNAALSVIRGKIKATKEREATLLFIESWCSNAEKLPPPAAYRDLNKCLPDLLHRVAVSLGPHCDVYLGERLSGTNTIKFMATSKLSAMQNVTLSDTSSLTFQTMKSKEATVVNHLRTNYRDVQFLTSRRPTGAVVYSPLFTTGESFGILTIDSFGPPAFALNLKVENDVLVYIQALVRHLCRIIMSLRKRYSIDQIAKLKRNPQATLRDLYYTLLVSIQRDVLSVQSQQIVELATDFTGAYRVLCWYRSPARRKEFAERLKIHHHCYEHDCTLEKRKYYVHYDTATLPMTNLPQALDEARRDGKAIYQKERRGQVPCFTGILDSAKQSMQNQRIALCVYGSGYGEIEPADVEQLHKLFTTANQVYDVVLKRSLIHTVALQGMNWLKERMAAKETCVATCLLNQKLSSHRSPGITLTTSEEKFPPGHIKSKGWRRLMDFISTEEIVKVIDLTSEDHKRFQKNYTVQREKYEAAIIEYEKKIAKQNKGVFSRKRKSAAEEETPPIPPPPPPPMLYLILVRITSPKDSNTRVAEIIQANLEISMFDKVDFYKDEAKTIATRCRECVSDYIKTYPRDVDMQTVLLDQIHQADFEAFDTRTEAIEEEVRPWLQEPQQAPVFPRTIIFASALMLGYRQSYLDNVGLLLRNYLKEKLMRKMRRVDASDSKTWPPIMRAKLQLATLDLGLARATYSEAMSLFLDLIFVKLAIARWSRHLHDVEKTRMKLYVSCAVKIQSLLRGVYTRMLLAEMARELAAVILIQTKYRQRLARKLLVVVRENRAARTIQRFYRRVFRKKHVGLKGSMLSGMQDIAAMRARNSQLAADNLVSQLNSHWYKQSDEVLDTWEGFIKSKFGKSELKTEVKSVHAKLKELAKERSSMDIIERRIEELKDLFEFFDIHNSGAITKEEGRTILEKLRIPLVGDEVDDALDMIDSDKSGDISLHEFTNWYGYEYESLAGRSKTCGTMSSKDVSWFANSQAQRIVEKRWVLWNQAKQKKESKKSLKI